MRNYNKKIKRNDIIIDISNINSTNEIRKQYYYFSDNNCYWGILINNKIYYSIDDIFNTEKENATHIITFLK